MRQKVRGLGVSRGLSTEGRCRVSTPTVFRRRRGHGALSRRASLATLSRKRERGTSRHML
jgi:hypothetical protein